MRQMASSKRSSALGDRSSHNHYQMSNFNDPGMVSQFMQPLPDDIQQVRVY